jgi:hypothetical protein
MIYILYLWLLPLLLLLKMRILSSNFLYATIDSTMATVQWYYCYGTTGSTVVLAINDVVVVDDLP